MKTFKSFSSKLIKILKRGGMGVIPTDTIYGLVGSALNKKTVEKIYKLRRRNPKKPMIVLIGQISDLKKFKINLKPSAEGGYRTVSSEGGSASGGKTYNLKPNTWPLKTSIILPCPAPRFKYLHRGTKTLAFRLPKLKKLRDFLRQTGPLVAPSANLEGKPGAKTIAEVRKYFSNKVDFYVDSGRLNRKPSKLIKIENSQVKHLRR